MSVFSTLRAYLRSLTGKGEEDAAAEPKELPPQKRPLAKPVQRKSQGDGFDAGYGGSRVDLSGGLKVPLLELEVPAAEPSFIAQTDFNASLDDLPALIDEPLGEQPEFIPEGGMSTQSLMREFDALDQSVTEAVAAAEVKSSETPATSPGPGAEPHAAAPLTAAGFTDPPRVVESQTADPQTVEPQSAEPLTAASLTPEPPTAMPLVAEAPPAAPRAPELNTAETRGAGTPVSRPPEELAPPPDAVDLAEFATPDSTFAFAESSLAESAFESGPSRSEEPVVEAPSDEESSFEESSFEPAPRTSTPRKPERLAPAWLIAPTTPVAKRPEIARGPEFNASLDDLGLLVEEPPAAEPEAPTSSPASPPGEPEHKG